jgi:hypothetical protein
MRQPEVKRNTQRIRDNKEELVERMARAVPEDGTLEAFPGFRLSRASGPTEPVQSVYPPSFCFVAQGKQQPSGERVHRTTVGTAEHYPTEELAREALRGLRMQINEARNRQPEQAIHVADLSSQVELYK